MKKQVTLALILLCCSLLVAQRGQTAFPWHTDARSLATGGHKIPYQQVETSCVSVHYITPYQIQDLAIRRLKFSIPIEGTLLQLELEQAGDNVFQETALSLGAGRHLSSSIFLSVQTGCYLLSTANGNRGNTLFTELLCLYRPSDYLTIGSYVYNPTRATIKTTKGSSFLPQGFHLGCSLQPAHEVIVILETEKPTGEPLMWHGGFEYRLVTNLSLLIGMSGPPFKPSWGICGNIRPFSYAVGGSLHPTLGLTSAISLYYNLKNK